MSLRDRSDSAKQREYEAVNSLALWLVLGAFVAYWWFMARAVRSLLGSVAELARWFRDWREEDRR